VGVDELQREEEVLADDAEETEAEQRLEGGVAAVGRMPRSTLTALGPTKMWVWCGR
jgi:hypothetical protein